ncbi:MAG TPA: hypothetical protein VK422_21305 [Pyrinomonadaceae bacterium]|nr:hypothetical protein [Pyrinomonadaceae bacterium]
MRTLLRTAILIGLLVTPLNFSLGQDRPGQSVEGIREKIKQLEGVEAASGSQAILLIAKRKMLRRYSELAARIEGEIENLNKLRSPDDADMEPEIKASTDEFRRELARVSEKIRELRGDLARLASEPVATAPAAAAASPASDRPAPGTAQVASLTVVPASLDQGYVDTYTTNASQKLPAPSAALRPRTTEQPDIFRGSLTPGAQRQETDSGDKKDTTKTTAAADQKPTTVPDHFSSIYTRAIVGFEQTGASAAGSEQKPFLEFAWNPPLLLRAARRTRKGETTPTQRSATEAHIYPTMSLWSSLRFPSAPRQIATPLATFATSFLTPIAEGKVNEMVQSFDFLVGVEKGLYRKGETGDINIEYLPTGRENVVQRHSTYFIAGIGAINPLNPRSTIQIFARPTNAADLKRITDQTLPDTIKYIAFVSPDRQSFFRQYYAGIRLKTHFFEDLGEAKKDQRYKVVNRPGAVFDVTVGQNEAVTGGRLRGTVLRMEGFYPFPILDSSSLYLYGTGIFNLRRNPQISDPLILATAPSTVTVPNPEVFIVTSPLSNRDYYRIGIGVNFIELFNKIRGGAGRSQAAPANQPTTKNNQPANQGNTPANP